MALLVRVKWEKTETSAPESLPHKSSTQRNPHSDKPGCRQDLQWVMSFWAKNVAPLQIAFTAHCLVCNSIGFMERLTPVPTNRCHVSETNLILKVGVLKYQSLTAVHVRSSSSTRRTVTQLLSLGYLRLRYKSHISSTYNSMLPTAKDSTT